MSIEALSGKVLLLITGASRGIGRQIAITFGSLLQRGSHILLLARSANALQEVAKNISSDVTVHTVSIDLAKATETSLKGEILFLLRLYMLKRDKVTKIFFLQKPYLDR